MTIRGILFRMTKRSLSSWYKLFAIREKLVPIDTICFFSFYSWVKEGGREEGKIKFLLSARNEWRKKYMCIDERNTGESGKMYLYYARRTAA